MGNRGHHDEGISECKSEAGGCQQTTRFSEVFRSVLTNHTQHS